jgi:hypothetical protein
MQNKMPTVYIPEIHCCKNAKYLSTFNVLYKIIKMLIFLKI